MANACSGLEKAENRKVEFVKWNSLNQFHEVIKAINYRKYAEYLASRSDKLEFMGKIKLHGTNASVTITPEGKVLAGKRSSFLPEGGIGGDNAGFAAWVKKHEEYFAGLAWPDLTTTLYGEWCGPGVQNNVACSMTDKKMFYVFSLDIVGGGCRTRHYNPEEIEQFLEKVDYGIDEMMVLPFHCRIEMDFRNAESMKTTLANINTEVESIGKVDPFMLENFEIEGCGEGLVFYPTVNEDFIYDDEAELELFSVFNFKAKSEDHRVNKTKQAVQANPEQIATMKNFGDMFCTEARFEQAFLEAVEREKDMKRTGDFIKWCCVDVMKESETERETIAVSWDKLSKVVASRAAAWYRTKCTTTE